MQYVSLSGGNIVIKYLRQDHEDKQVFPGTFEGECAAADALCERMIKTDDTRVLTSSSVNHPDDEGCPDFNFDRMWDRVMDRMERAGVQLVVI